MYVRPLWPASKIRRSLGIPSRFLVSLQEDTSAPHSRPAPASFTDAASFLHTNHCGVVAPRTGIQQPMSHHAPDLIKGVPLLPGAPFHPQPWRCLPDAEPGRLGV